MGWAWAYDCGRIAAHGGAAVPRLRWTWILTLKGGYPPFRVRMAERWHLC